MAFASVARLAASAVVLAVFFGATAATKGNSKVLPPELQSAFASRAAALLGGDASAADAFELEASDIAFHGLALWTEPRPKNGASSAAILLVQKSALRGWEVADEANLALAIFDPDTGALRVRRLLDDPKAREYPAPEVHKAPRPPASAARTTMTKVYRVDLRQLPGMPGEAGEFAARALAFDWVSNAARVNLGSAAPPIRPAAIHPAAASEPARLPAFEKSARHDPAPPSGAALRLEPLRSGGSALLLSIAMPARPSQILEKAAEVPGTGSSRRVAAVIRVALAVVGLDGGIPSVSTWSVPVFADEPVLAGQRIVGYLALDLRTLSSAATLPNAPQVVFAFAGDEVGGPLPLPPNVPR
jgi:hypothetical protein